MHHKNVWTWKDFLFVAHSEYRFLALSNCNEQNLICKPIFFSKLMIFKQILPVWKSEITLARQRVWSRALAELNWSPDVVIRPNRWRPPTDACFVSFSPTWLGVRWKCSLQCSQKSYMHCIDSLKVIVWDKQMERGFSTSIPYLLYKLASVLEFHSAITKTEKTQGEVFLSEVKLICPLFKTR